MIDLAGDLGGFVFLELFIPKESDTAKLADSILVKLSIDTLDPER